MSYRRHQRISTLLRNSLLLLLALCLMAQPVVAAWGELHETVTHADAAIGHAGHHSPHPADDDATGGDSAANDPGHQLLHHAHCCAQGQLPLSSTLSLDILPPVSAMRWAASSEPAAKSPSAPPFRPPIRA